MLDIGHYSELRVVERTAHGLILSDEEDTVLLPNKFVPKSAKIGDALRVFVYTDSDDLPIATTQTPKASVGEFAFLKVVGETEHGAFLDWGLDKDLFVHKSEQHNPMRVGVGYVVAVYRDDDTGRVAATSKLSQFLERATDELSVDQEVEVLVFNFIDRGAQVIVEQSFAGLIYASETFQNVEIGSKLRAYVKAIRPDGKVDVTLQRSGILRVLDGREIVLRALEKNGGRLALSDRSPPEQIYEELGLSKKAFKAAIGSLYKSRRIVLREDGIELVKPAASS